jgi:hypothetical protein
VAAGAEREPPQRRVVEVGQPLRRDLAALEQLEPDALGA